jgi:hypothetical protein
MTIAHPRLAYVTALGLFAACGSEPGTLIITLDFVPEVVTTTTVSISGTVTRTPPKNTTVTISAQGGQVAVTDTADANGVFSMSVRLRTNRESTIELLAADEEGSTSVPEMITLVHDDQGPAVASMTPANQQDDAPTTGDVTITFNEPLVFGSGATVELVTAGPTIGGVASRSADSLTITFTPQSARRPNAVYVVRLTNITDVAGNAPGASSSGCFVTQRTAPELVESDPQGDIFGMGVTSPADLLEVRLGTAGPVLTGVLKFSSNRGFDFDAPSNVFVVIELDTDQDPSTGVTSIKDTIFTSVDRSGIRPDYLIDAEPYSQFADSAIVGRYTAPFEFDLTELFQPPFCGPYLGFSASFDALGADDGNFDFTVVAFTLQDSTGFAGDPAPETGHFTASFAGQFTPSALADRAERQSTRAVTLPHRFRQFLRRR